MAYAAEQQPSTFTGWLPPVAVQVRIGSTGQPISHTGSPFLIQIAVVVLVNAHITILVVMVVACLQPAIQ